jgi:5'-3' exonuclease
MKALVDGDIIVYRCAFAAESTLYGLHEPGEEDSPEPGKFIKEFQSAKELKEYVKKEGITDYARSTRREIEPVSHVLYNIKHSLAAIMGDSGASDMAIYLSEGENFRHKKATLAGYKANRKAPKPYHYEAAREYLIDVHGAEVCTSIEADDALAMNQTEDTVICSIDKDLLQVPGRHYNWTTKDEKGVQVGSKRRISERHGLERLWAQVLTGDKTDNIPGIKGIGEVTALKKIANCRDEKAMFQLCKREWTKAMKDDKVQLFDPKETAKTPHEIVLEIHMLVKVGGFHAEEAINGEDD